MLAVPLNNGLKKSVEKFVTNTFVKNENFSQEIIKNIHFSEILHFGLTVNILPYSVCSTPK
jgi:hypothetical protein